MPEATEPKPATRTADELKRDPLIAAAGHLGLTITQAIIAAHNGTITVLSEPEAGTSFVITLPRADDAEVPQVMKDQTASWSV